ncbi:hypothetical protein D3093_26735 (plasmid) [Azospirillum argentinense]|uniref:Uncharacterized protein n=1 Tax=Azospirillum argentinense TaxID=2970906 RepID=A0A4D8PNS2_9PROT|nr:hypothetical protein D3093_26735 [Azospirillum argentinense]
MLAIRGYVVIGAAPLLVYYSLALLIPDQVLHIVYGTASPTEQELPLRCSPSGADRLSGGDGLLLLLRRAAQPVRSW